VLDLDNTLWGGVIGDDGLQGIRLGQGFADGEAFLDVQWVAKCLRQRGIILAVSSKNTDDIARQPFREHPDMLLSESDITVFQANWMDKATNIEAIATTLDIGLDAIVFLDDNPAERELVRQRLPSVAVPELPDDPSLFSRTLLNAGYFDVISYASEDGMRADMYTARAQAASLKTSFTDIDSYLDSLQMVVEFSRFDSIGRSRIAQLINKSNQFNLTTRRYNENEVREMETDSRLITLQIRLKDRFSDHGMISVVVVRNTEPSVWMIDTWLMSCRVLGRRLEEAVLAKIITGLRELKASKLIGEFIPSGRNDMVKLHYEKLGFCFDRTIESSCYWILSIEDYVQPKIPILLKF
jgi:FkbH-like protein